MNIAISLVYTIGWFACIYLASLGDACLAAGIPFLLALLLLLSIYFYDQINFASDLQKVIIALLIGFFIELIMVNADVIKYQPAGYKGVLPPFWILSLYPLFALTLNHSLSFIKNNRIYPLIVACLAPFSYLAGLKFGIASFPHGVWTMVVVVILLWSFLLTVLCSTQRGV